VSRRSPAVRAGLLIGSTHDAAQALLRTAAARTPAARGRAVRCAIRRRRCVSWPRC